MLNSKRLLFYGALALISYLVADNLLPQIEAKAAARALAAFAVVAGIVQSVTLAVVSKLVNISKLEGLAYWSKKRLIENVQHRIHQLKARLLLGVISAVAIGLLAGAAFAIGTSNTPIWLSWLAIFFASTALLFAISAILEFIHINNLEIELSDKASRAEKKREYFKPDEDES